MWRKTYSSLAALFLLAVSAFAQSGEYSSYSPYTIFGLGDLSKGYSAYNSSMGGVGIASRNHRYLNTINPAAVAVRDSLAFMIDFSVFNTNTLYRQTFEGKSYKSANNNTNIGGLAISFPIWRTMAMAVGLKPYSSVGYSIASPVVGNADLGATKQSYDGRGSLYNGYAALGWDYKNRFSVGAEADYIFGKIQKEAAQSVSATDANVWHDYYTLTLTAFTGKFGAQYVQPIGSSTQLCFGATYSFGANIHGFNEYKHYSSGSVQNAELKPSYSDTLSGLSGVRIAGELGLGVSINYQNRLRAEFDYTRSDWRGTGLDVAKGFAVSDAQQPFRCSVRESFRLGMEYVPNQNDVRYYRKRIAYRAGAYYTTDYYTVAGSPVNSAGITIGATLPVFRWYNGITVMMDFGQRGPFQGSLVRENFLRFGVSVNLFDIWFQQPRYD